MAPQLLQFKNWLWENKKSIGLLVVGLIVGLWLKGNDVNPITSLLSSDRLAEKTTSAFGGIGNGSAAQELSLEPANPSGTTKTSGSPSSGLIIKTGSLSLLVKDVRISVKQVASLTEGFGGYVSSSSVSVIDETKNQLTATATVRVPVEKYNEAFDSLKSLAIKVKNESSTGEDVTQQYTDLGSRLKNLEAAETQLYDIMKNAKETKDVLSVFGELTNIRGQIEQIRGQMQYLERSGKLATITVYFATEENELPIVEGKWTPLTALKEALRDLVKFWQNAADKGIYWLIFGSPFIVLAGILVLWRLIKKRTAP